MPDDAREALAEAERRARRRIEVGLPGVITPPVTDVLQPNAKDGSSRPARKLYRDRADCAERILRDALAKLDEDRQRLAAIHAYAGTLQPSDRADAAGHQAINEAFASMVVYTESVESIRHALAAIDDRAVEALADASREQPKGVEIEEATRAIARLAEARRKPSRSGRCRHEPGDMERAVQALEAVAANPLEPDAATWIEKQLSSKRTMAMIFSKTEGPKKAAENVVSRAVGESARHARDRVKGGDPRKRARKFK